MYRRILILSLAFALMLLVVSPFRARQATPTLKKQAKETSTIEDLTATERESLNDPFFHLVLKDNAGAITLAKVEEFLLARDVNRRVFVVDERIQTATADGQVRRAVVAYTGSHPAGFVLTNNVMLSLSFRAAGFAETAVAIEAWGFDSKRGRFNYYKLDEKGGMQSWKFRGSSVGADKLSAAERAGTCLACHINGAPVMKELDLPWNNWHGSLSRQSYLEPDSRTAWPAANSPRLKGSLTVAQDLELSILATINRFNRERIDAGLEKQAASDVVKVDADGFAKVLEAKRLLKPLFVTTEFNLNSSEQSSGLHPFDADSATGPGADVAVPNRFFLNSDLIGSGASHGYKGLKIDSSEEFVKTVKVKPEEYKQLVTKSKLSLRGKPVPGDTHFAWLVPTASHIDSSMVDLLMKQKLVTPQFVAAVLAVDVRTPVFSKDRAGLLEFVPTAYRFKRVGTETHPENELTKETVRALEAATPAAGTPAAEFLKLLKSADPVDELRQKVNDYHEEVKKRLGDAATRPAELERLFKLAITRRQEVLKDAVLKNLDETKSTDGKASLLLPLPAP